MLKLFKSRGVPKLLLNNYMRNKEASMSFYNILTTSDNPNKCGFPFTAVPNPVSSRCFSISSTAHSEEETKPAKPVDPSKDRSKVIPPETSILYMKSKAYKTTYGDEPVWVKYRRNFKGQFVPRKTREQCIRKGVITTGSPCPICRDEYLVLHYTNVELLKQFVHPQTGEIYDTRKTHICQKQLLQLEVALKQAKFCGLLTYEVPFRSFDYTEYYPQLKNL